MKQTIKVALVCKGVKNTENNKEIKLLNLYIPQPPSCDLEVITICSPDLNSNVIEQLAEFEPDIIFHYSLELGSFFQEFNNSINIKDREIIVVSDNHSIRDLFEVSNSYMVATHHDILKQKIGELDLIKSRPSKLYVAKTEDDLKYLKDRCFREAFGADTETNFLNPFVKDPEPKLLCYSLAWPTDDEEAWCIPTSEALIQSGNCLFNRETVMKYTEEIFFESLQPQFWHNFAYDGLALFELFKKKPKNFMADTMVLLNLYHYASKSAALKNNTHLIHLPAYKEPIKDWLEEQTKILSKRRKEAKGKAAKDAIEKKIYGYEDVPLNIIAPYAAMDALAVVRLINFLKANLPKSLWKFYYKIPHKVIQTANELACEGYTISRDRFLFSKIEFENQISETHKSAMSLIDKYIDDKANFNIVSSQQLGDILFNKDKLNLPVFHKTKKTKSASTDQKALDDLILFHPFIFKLSKLKKLLKLYSTYSYRGYSGVLNEGSRSYKRVGHWTINAQYKQTNRTARLGSTNFTQHHGVKKTGGPILTLPAQGSMVKHIFNPNVVSEAENVLYDKIVAKLSEADKLKIKQAEAFDISVNIKPDKNAAKKSKKLTQDEPNDNNLIDETE